MEHDSRVVPIGRRADPTDEQFRLLVASVSEYAIYLLDASGAVASWNAGAQRIKGYKADEIIGRHYSVFYTAEDRVGGRPEANLQRAQAEGHCAGEGWRLRRDGSRFWAAVTITALRDERGTLKGYAKVTRDMTERHLAEEQVRASQRQLQAFTDNSPLAMCVKDRDGRYRFANKQFLERHGFTLQQIVGRSDAELFPHRQAAELAARDGDVLARGVPVEYEARTRHFGAERVSMVSKFPLFDSGGVISGVGVVATDITDRRLTEQALREQRTLLAEAERVAGLGSWEWTPESGRLAWSPELYRIHGVTPETFEPSFENYLERVHPDDRQQSGAMMARALMDGRGFTMQERIMRPGGEVRYVRSHAEVVRAEGSGKPVKILGACLDITEQRHSERALRQAAQDLHALTRRLVQAEEAERRRVARELHDRVGQSLSALNINLDIIAREGRLPAALQQRLDDSLGLVDGTLQSVESVMAELRPPLLDEYGIGAALGWYAEDFRRRTGIATEVVEGAPAQAKALRGEAAVALFRIAQEALQNVVKHAHARKVEIAISADAEGIVLTVSDDGQGFDAAAVPKGRWGTTTMRERAEAVGARFEVQSAPGAGTVVRVRVPL